MLPDNIMQGASYKDDLMDLSLGQQIYDSLESNQSVFVDGETRREVTFREIFDKTCRLAVALKDLGLTQSDVVGIFSENCLEFIYPVVAGLFLGCTVTPFNPQYTSGELLHTAGISQPTVMFCSEATVDLLLKMRSRIPSLRKVIIMGEAGRCCENLEEFIKGTEAQAVAFVPVTVDVEKHVALILYSSGTTGLPKGVKLTHRNFNAALSFSRNPAYFIKFPPGALALLGLLPFFHTFGFCVILLCLRNAAKLVVLRSFKPEAFLRAVQDHRMVALYLVPSLASFLASHPLVDAYDLSSLKLVTCGAAPLSKKVQDAFTIRFPDVTIRQGYGMTESVGAVTGFPLGSTDKSNSCGKVLPNASVKIIDGAGAALGPNEKGEICCKGAMVMQGYFQNEAATKETIDEAGWLHTGDMGYYDEEGYLYVVDRMKELIKYKGFQVAPAEIEALLLTHPGVIDAGVVGRPDEKAGELSVAFVVRRDGLSENDVQDFVAGQLSPAKHLHGGVVFVDEIPRNASGKILRKELKKQLPEEN